MIQMANAKSTIQYECQIKKKGMLTIETRASAYSYSFDTICQMHICKSEEERKKKTNGNSDSYFGRRMALTYITQMELFFICLK